MNKHYRSIWNHVTETFVAAAENAKSGGRKARTTVAATALSAFASFAPIDVANAYEAGGGSAAGEDGVAVGAASNSGTGAGNTAIGADTVVNGVSSTAVGFGASAEANNALALGADAAANRNNAIAVGAMSVANGVDSVAIGTGAMATYDNAVALGANARATGGNTLALGTGAVASPANSVALGAGAVSSRSDSVSIGNATQTRQITNMGNGTSDSDGATVRQVRGVAAMVGGGAAISSSGSPVLPSFRVAGTNYTNVGAAVSALDVQTSSNAAAIANLANAPRLVLQDATSKVLTVGKDVAGTSVNLTGTAGTRTLTGVKAGTLAAGSTEAVNGAQLHATNQQVSTNTTNIANNTTNIATNSTNIQNNTTAINNIATGRTGLVQQDATSKVLTVGKDVAGTSVNLTGTAGARTLTGVKAGALSAASTEAVNGAQLHATNQQVSTNTTNIANNTTNIATNSTNIQNNTTAINNIATGKTGLVQQDATSKVLTVGKDVAGTSVNLTGTAGTRTLTGVKAGTLAAGSTEAVNGAQLHATNQQVSTNTTNIANNTTNIQNNATAINNIATGKTGLVQQDATSKVLTVGKDVAGTSVNLTGTAGARTLTGVKAGALSAASTEAVNGAQLHATNQQVSVNTTNIANNTTNIATNSTNIQNNTTAINNIATGKTGLVQQDATSKVLTVGKDVAGTSVNLTGTAGTRTLTGVKAGTLSAASTEAVNGAQLHATNQQVSVNTTNIASNTTNIATNTTNIQNNTTAINNIATGRTGLVQQDPTSKVLTVGKDVAGTSVNLTGTAGTRTLTGVKAGTLAAGSTEAVNGAQLHATNQQVSTNTTNIANNTTNIATNSTNIQNNTTAINNIATGRTGLVQQDATSKVLTVGKDVAGTSVNFTGTAGVRTLTGVKAGTLSAASTDAVNGAQLHATNQQVSVNTTNIANNATNIATNATNIANNTTNIANNTQDIGDINTALSNITNGATGLVQQDTTSKVLTVGNATDGASVNFTGTAGARTLTGVKAGAVSAGSTEAVNGAQLHATNQQVSVNTTNIANNTSDIGDINTAITRITNGAAGLVQQNATTRALTVGKTTDGTSVDFAGTAGARTLTGVKAGTLSAASTEAVNGAQLHATNQQVSTNSTNIQNNTTAINNIATGRAGLVQQDAASKVLTVGKDVNGTSVNFTGTAGARTLTGVKAGALSAASTEAVNGAQLHATNQQVSINTTNIENNTQDIGDINTALSNITNGATGLVQQDATSKVLTVGKDVDGASVNFTGTAGVRTLTGVKAGALSSASTEAVNGAQLHATNQQVSTNTTNIANNTTNIATNTTNIANNTTSIENNTQDIGDINTAITNITNGTTGLVQQDATSKGLTVGRDVAGTSVNFTGTAGARTLTGVKAGTLSAASTEAVNGAQLHATNQQVSTNTTNIANNTTNIATNTTNIENNTQDIGDINTAITNITNGAAGLVQQDATSRLLTVGKDVDGTSVDFTGTAGVRTLTGVKAGAVAAASTDAVNGAQLHTTNQRVSTNSTNIQNNTTNIATNTTNIANNTSDIDDLSTAITNITNGTTGLVQQDATSKALSVGKDVAGTSVDFTGTAGVRTLTGVKAGALSAGSTEAVNGAQLHATNQQVSVNTTNIENNTTDINEINTNITDVINGTTGLVQQDATTKALTVGKDVAGTSVNFAGTAGARQLDGVAAGTVSAGSLFAVNGGQFYGASLATANALGGGATVGANGAITAPTYNVGGTTVHSVGAAVTNLDGRLAGVEGSVTTVTNQINNGEIGLVKQDAATGNISMAADKGGKMVDISGKDGSRKMTGVADGAIAAGSSDAVNGGQIYALTERVGTISTATSYFAADGTGDGGDAARAAGGSQGVAAGSKANASGNGSVAIGRSAEAAGDKAVSMGAGATATASNSVAIGADAVADRADTVSVGAAGAERQIANVAAGTAATDAVNVSQMESHGKNTVARANAYTDARIDSNRREANAGVASAMAMAGLPQATAAGKSMVAMAGSTFNGESAMALGVSQVSKSGRWVYKAVASSNTRGNYGATLGAGFQW